MCQKGSHHYLHSSERPKSKADNGDLLHSPRNIFILGFGLYSGKCIYTMAASLPGQHGCSTQCSVKGNCDIAIHAGLAIPYWFTTYQTTNGVGVIQTSDQDANSEPRHAVQQLGSN